MVLHCKSTMVVWNFIFGIKILHDRKISINILFLLCIILMEFSIPLGITFSVFYINKFNLYIY